VRILDVAEQLARERGFNGFSYANVAAELGLTSASLHYHFRGKAELGEALITRDAERFACAPTIDAGVTYAHAKLAAFAGLYADRLNGRRVCLCAVLVAEYETLPEPMRRAIDRFFSDSEEWLATVLEQGRTGGSLSFEALPRDAAGMIIGGLVGAMLLARSNDDVNRFRSAASLLLATVAG
jgi:TetR/AcrR family transcriptional repressor of nem operon